jgi:hypothetical protein
MVVLVGESAAVGRAEALIEALDQDRLVEPVYFLYHLKNARAAEAAEVLRAMLRASVPGGKADTPNEQEILDCIVADEERNLLLLTTGMRFEAQARELVEKLDRPRPQVRVAVQILEAKRGGGVGLLGGPDTFDRAKASKSAEQTAAFLKQLSDDGRLGRGWRSEVLAVDGRESVVRMGEEKSGGIRVTLVPRVSPDGIVTLQLGEEAGGSGGHAIRTEVRVRDGESAVAAEFPISEDGKAGVLLVGAVVVKGDF